MADVIFPPLIKLNRLPLESSGQTGHGGLCRGYRHQLSSGPVHEIDRPCALKNISPAFFLSFFLPIIECMRTQLEEKFPSSLIDWLCFYVKIGINPRAFFFFGRGAGNVVGYGPPVSIYSARFGGCWQIPIVLCPPLSLFPRSRKPDRYSRCCADSVLFIRSTVQLVAAAACSLSLLLCESVAESTNQPTHKGRPLRLFCPPTLGAAVHARL